LVKAELLDASAATLDENHQHNDEQHAGCNPDKRGTVHFEFLSLRGGWKGASAQIYSRTA